MTDDYEDEEDEDDGVPLRKRPPEATGGYHPLNPRLYGVLQSQFSQIEVASEGEAFVCKPEAVVVNGRKTFEILSAGEYYRVCCPFCREGRFRLWVNHMYGVYSDVTQSYNRNLAICYNEDCLTSPENRQQFHNWTVGLMNLRRGEKIKVGRGKRESLQLLPSSPPGKLTPLTDLPLSHHANLYLAERGYDPHRLAAAYSLSYCYDILDQRYSLALDRIVAPMFQKDMMVGWQCRHIGDLDWKSTGVPKYFTKPGMPKRLLLYNYDQAKKHEVVVVCEGISDVWSVGPMAVAILGKKLHHHQKRLLANTWGKGLLVMMLDREVFAEVEGLVPELQGMFEYGVLPVEMPGKDPGSFDPAFNRQLIIAAARQRGVILPSSFLATPV